MPKRKAKDLGDETVLDEPRRSSRRVIAPKESAVQETSKPATAPKKSKKSQKVEKEGPGEVNGDDKESPKSVSLMIFTTIIFRFLRDFNSEIDVSESRVPFPFPSFVFLSQLIIPSSSLDL